MNIIKTSVEPFRAKVTFGLNKGYTAEVINRDDFIKKIQIYQDNLIREDKIYLSVSISETSIVLNGQNEPHLILNFINYPKFPLDPIVLKIQIQKLIEKMMILFEQNRVVIEFIDETVMLEYSSDIDPKIKI